MRALYSLGGSVPLARVLREYRAALVPLALVFAVNLVVLVAVVLPLEQRASASEGRYEAAERARVAGEAEFKRAEMLRDGKARATGDLETFYAKVLPSNVADARRLLQLKLHQQAREHGVRYQGAGTTEQEIRGSSLRRLTMQARLTGEYDDIRAFIYDLETARDFVVIDNLRLAEGTEAGAPLAVTLEVSTYYRTAPASAVLTSGDGR